jgi:cation:H+ antiporter
LPVLFAIFLFLAAVIVVAGLYLAKFADAIADLTGMGRTLAGLILLAAATSLPELAVDCKAVVMTPPAPDMAVGALVGSSLFNLLILGVLDLLNRRSDKMISPASNQHILSATTSILLTALVAGFILLQNPKLQIANVGMGSFVVFSVYVLSLRLTYLDQKHRGVSDEESSAEMKLPAAILGYVAATAVIFLAANWLAPTADEIARQTGLGGTFVGSTFVALTTSLPELVTTAAAVRMGAFDMAVGNIVGSNNFNMAILFPVDMVFRDGPLLQVVSLAHVFTAAMVIAISSVLVLAMVYKPKRRYLLIEPDASAIVLLAVMSIVILYYIA